MRLATAGLLFGFACSPALATEPAHRTLSFEERVKAQAAIERVYYSHQLGATKPFDDAIPKAVLEAKVRKYLDQAAALGVYWKTAVTDDMLRRELLRMSQGTRMPERLKELYAALGNDSFLIKECLARATLVDRLTRNFYAFDPKLHAGSREEAEQLHRRLASGELSPSVDTPHRTVNELVKSETGSKPESRDTPFQQRLTPEEFQTQRAGLPAHVGEVPDVEESRDEFAFDVVLGETKTSVRIASYVIPKTAWDSWWDEARRKVSGEQVEAVATDQGPLLVPSSCAADDTWLSEKYSGAPDRRTDHTAVWTGSVMVVWGGAGWALLNTGGRYDPATDTWMATSRDGAPTARYGHTAVWTGSEMVVWGGAGGELGTFNTGGRYDPVADIWTPTSVVDAPARRSEHTAVWTGSRMIVWGGLDNWDNLTLLDSGGVYDPVNDVWTATSTTGAPSPRYDHVAVWTGALMVVWGGNCNYDSTTCDVGGRYDPSTDTWAPTSTTNAPRTGGYDNTAVWAGGRMVVMCLQYVNHASSNPVSGYDPVADTWTPVTTINHSAGGWAATSTGQSMLVWGGLVPRYHSFDDKPRATNSGFQYDPVTNKGNAMTGTGAPPGSRGATAVWTGNLMLVWGGYGGGSNRTLLNTGGRYDLSTDSWTPISTEVADAPSARADHTAVWTGSLMVVWGGFDNSAAFTSGGRYDPATDSWTPTSTTNAPDFRGHYSTVWTGSLMVIWGGAGNADFLNTGGRYDPASDTWTPTSTTGAPSARYGHSAVWTGSSMVVWGGGFLDTYLNTGGRYDPATDTWTPMTTTASPAARTGHTAVWTGSSMIVWGGSSYDGVDHIHNTGGRYDPATDSWSPTSVANAPTGRYQHSAVWTGSVMVVWGGITDYFGLNSGGRYDPASDSWTPTSMVGAPEARFSHTAVWTGRSMVVWGGTNDPWVGFNSGGRYDPATDNWTPTSMAGAPPERSRHTAVWTGSLVIVWGGDHGVGHDTMLNTGGRYVVAPDGDGDGYTECEGDCNDADPAVHPEAAETCNGIDDDCDGTVDNGGDALCDDGNACTVGDTCSGGVCVSGAPLICSALDQCHTAGVCDPATGICSNPSQPDGTSCDDANLCTAGETCQSGTCTAAFDGLNHPAPKSSGYYKKLCEKRRHNQLPYQGDQLTDADAVCVGGLTSTFAGIATIDDICNVIDQNQHGGQNHGGPGNGPNGKECEKGEDELIATALNACRARVCEEQQLDSNCNGNAHTTVSQSFADADAILDDAARSKDTCKIATCELREINNGHALEMNSLLLAKENSKVRLTWSSPVLDDGSGAPSTYEVWRRPLGSNDAFVKIGTTTGIAFLDSTAANGAWEYDITAVIPEQ